jgi:hypothetical protein
MLDQYPSFSRDNRILSLGNPLFCISVVSWNYRPPLHTMRLLINHKVDKLLLEGYHISLQNREVALVLKYEQKLK